MAQTVFANLDELRAGVGRHLGHSDWLEVTQERVDLFAEVTGEDGWIYLDVARAAAESPYGGTIVPGLLTLSLSNLFLPQIVDVQGTSMGVNYGVERVRFPAPVPVGSRLRAGAEVAAVAEVSGGVQATITITIEVEGGDQPACVIDALSRYLA